MSGSKLERDEALVGAAWRRLSAAAPAEFEDFFAWRTAHPAGEARTVLQAVQLPGGLAGGRKPREDEHSA